MNRLTKYFYTMRYLKWEQYYYRIYKNIRPIKFNIDKRLSYHQWPINWNTPIYKEQSLFEDGKCVFLNKHAIIAEPADWNNSSKDKLWLYNLHYFDDLDAQNSEQRIQNSQKWILKWIDENPAAIGNGWEPYPISQRIVNWIKWLSKNSLTSAVIDESLALQARVLEQKIEYHLIQLTIL